jgi:hypothetical protein
MTCKNCAPAPGGTTVCDTCASAMIQALNTALPNEDIELPRVLTPTERAGLTTLTTHISDWFDEIEAGQAGHQRGGRA